MNLHSLSYWRAKAEAMNFDGLAYIDGRYCPAADGATFPCISPIFSAANMPEYQLPQLLSKAALCSQLAISVRTLENLVRAGDFPPPVCIGNACLLDQQVGLHVAAGAFLKAGSLATSLTDRPTQANGQTSLWHHHSCHTSTHWTRSGGSSTRRTISIIAISLD